MNKVRIVFFVLGALLLSESLFSQDIMSLPEAVRIALENNYDIKIADNTREISENDVTRGNAGFLPTVGVTAFKNFASNDTYQERNDANRTIVDIQGAKSEQASIGASFNWIVFDGLGMFYAYDRLGQQNEASNLLMKVTMENTVSEVLSTYYTVALEVERIKVLNNSLQLSERRLEIAQNKYEIGKASKVEFLAAQVDFNTDKTLLINEEQLLYQAKVDLNRVLARDVEANVEVDQTIDINENLVLGELLESANMKNPSLLQSQRQLNIAHLQMRELKSDRFPIVSLTTAYSKGNSSSQVGFAALTRTNGFNYGVTASLNIFNGFNVNRRVQNAKVQMETAEYTIADLRLSLEADINKMYNRYVTSLDLINIERQNLEVARENESIALERYQLGNYTPLELREAQINAVQAESRLINAAFSTKLAEIELLRLSGSLITTFSE
ncbi:TolC family protein [uncultured Imperialibacter sp.]|uniref:TolC family protein n=1 Tax=uncultured Imperialibacter sp. TaxID=1672639 RepID=UPI0030DBD8BA|tara:strand:+ start:2453 stop:3781 length:1329 start_codon:yes stop_codon:yes gene_type:complete